MAEKKKMTVAEMLAAARKADSKSGGEAPPEAPAAETPAPAAEVPAGEAAEAKPAAKKPAPAKPAAGGRPSVAEMMAAARAEKSGAAKPAEKPAPAAKKEVAGEGIARREAGCQAGGERSRGQGGPQGAERDVDRQHSGCRSLQRAARSRLESRSGGQAGAGQARGARRERGPQASAAADAGQAGICQAEAASR